MIIVTLTVTKFGSRPRRCWIPPSIILRALKRAPSGRPVFRPMDGMDNRPAVDRPSRGMDKSGTGVGGEKIRPQPRTQTYPPPRAFAHMPTGPKLNDPPLFLGLFRIQNKTVLERWGGGRRLGLSCLFLCDGIYISNLTVEHDLYITARSLHVSQSHK